MAATDLHLHAVVGIGVENPAALPSEVADPALDMIVAKLRSSARRVVLPGARGAVSLPGPPVVVAAAVAAACAVVTDQLIAFEVTPSEAPLCWELLRDLPDDFAPPDSPLERLKEMRGRGVASAIADAGDAVRRQVFDGRQTLAPGYTWTRIGHAWDDVSGGKMFVLGAVARCETQLLLERADSPGRAEDSWAAVKAEEGGFTAVFALSPSELVQLVLTGAR